MRAVTLYKVLAWLLALMAAALVLTHLDGAATALDLPGPVQVVAGLVAGFGIGVVAAIMSVAGGELLIPTIVLPYGIDIKLAGSLSLAGVAATALAEPSSRPARRCAQDRNGMNTTLAAGAPLDGVARLVERRRLA